MEGERYKTEGERGKKKGERRIQCMQACVYVCESVNISDAGRAQYPRFLSIYKQDGESVYPVSLGQSTQHTCSLSLTHTLALSHTQACICTLKVWAACRRAVETGEV